MDETSSRPPILYVIAGPNGAGKTTLYESKIAGHVTAEFVNADKLALEKFGHPARTAAESAEGQRLAEERRQTLMAERKSIVTESTFSHPSKVDMVRDAQAAGYKVVLFHVNVRNPEMSVARVEARVDKGGHPVPEDKIRARYERNQPLIREAALLADRALIFDNSRVGQPHQLAITLDQGRAIKIMDNVPAWARTLYEKELKAFSPERQNAAAASFKTARDIAAEQLGPKAHVQPGRHNGRYAGEIIGQTALHTLQQTAPTRVVAHFTSVLDRPMAIGERGVIQYQGQTRATFTPEREQTSTLTPIERAIALRSMSPADALASPDRELRSARQVLDKIADQAARTFPGDQNAQARAVTKATDKIADQLAEGKAIADPKPLGRTTSDPAPDIKTVKDRDR